MKKQISLHSLSVLLLVTAAIVFSATFFPMQYRAMRERERYERELASRVTASDRYDAEQLADVLDYLSRYSVYGLPESDALTEMLIEAVLSGMGDPYATYFNPEEYREWLESTSGKYFGVGATVIRTRDGFAEIVQIHPDSPMEGRGAVGDLIVGVNGESLQTIGYDEAIDRIRSDGTADPTVTLTLLRDGETLTLVLEREQIVKQSVLSEALSEAGRQIGYIRLTCFDGHTAAQLREAVLAHEAAGVEGIIFDLRSNGGGLLSAVSEILAFLLPDGEIAHVRYASEHLQSYTVSAENGQLRSGSGKPTEYYAGGHAVSVPVTVLIDGRTASAAELFSSAFRDYAAQGLVSAKLVGTTSYGKGTVQTTNSSLWEQGALKVSVAYYNPPCDVSYDGIGITPDRIAELPSELEGVSLFKLAHGEDTQLSAAIETLLEMLGG